MRNVKIIAHGAALRHNPDTAEMWEGSPAYGGFDFEGLSTVLGRVPEWEESPGYCRLAGILTMAQARL
jgi:hypothetical protein